MEPASGYFCPESAVSMIEIRSIERRFSHDLAISLRNLTRSENFIAQALWNALIPRQQNLGWLETSIAALGNSDKFAIGKKDCGRTGLIATANRLTATESLSIAIADHGTRQFGQGLAHRPQSLANRCQSGVEGRCHFGCK